VSLHIPTHLQKQIRRQFKDCCAYCKTAESLIATTFEIEHITPRSAGGKTSGENLCLACPHCNRHKATRQHFPDPETQQLVPLFHPQQQIWPEHFAWDKTCSTLIGLTGTGRATIAALEMNRPPLIRLRHLWHKFGEHPPT
jgi:HNH endonuclease